MKCCEASPYSMSLVSHRHFHPRLIFAAKAPSEWSPTRKLPSLLIHIRQGRQWTNTLVFNTKVVSNWAHGAPLR